MGPVLTTRSTGHFPFLGRISRLLGGFLAVPAGTKEIREKAQKIILKPDHGPESQPSAEPPGSPRAGCSSEAKAIAGRLCGASPRGCGRSPRGQIGRQDGVGPPSAVARFREALPVDTPLPGNVRIAPPQEQPPDSRRARPALRERTAPEAAAHRSSWRKWQVPPHSRGGPVPSSPPAVPPVGRDLLARHALGGHRQVAVAVVDLPRRR